jgi:hypothetical protein
MTGRKVKIRNALLIVTIELLAATLSLALPNLGEGTSIRSGTVPCSCAKTTPRFPALSSRPPKVSEMIDKLPKAALGIAE